uniref:RRM domain-containing protein n=1 Tax=Alexandrium andersonii TaxID=327968 RepID=A0A7S2HMZ6_9DINO
MIDRHLLFCLFFVFVVVVEQALEKSGWLRADVTAGRAIIASWFVAHLFCMLAVCIASSRRSWQESQRDERPNAVWIGPLPATGSLPSEKAIERAVRQDLQCIPLWVTVWDPETALASLRTSTGVDKFDDFTTRPFAVLSYNTKDEATEAVRNINMRIGEGKGGQHFSDSKAELLDPLWGPLRSRATYRRFMGPAAPEFGKASGSRSESEDDCTEEGTASPSDTDEFLLP